MVRLAFAVLLVVVVPSASQAPQAGPASISVDYRRGGVSVLDFLDAQRAYRETTLEHVRALGNYQTALNELEAAVGYREGR